jgi:hypothetical protein
MVLGDAANDSGDMGDSGNSGEVTPADKARGANRANPLVETIYPRLKNDIFNFHLFPRDRFSRQNISPLLKHRNEIRFSAYKSKKK